MLLPMNEAIVAVICQLIDDSKAKTAGRDYREPSHADIEFCVDQAGLSAFDPKQQGQTVGKAKRVRAILHAAMTNQEEAGSRLAHALLSKIRACGGFRPDSAHYAGAEAIANVKAAFATEGFLLTVDGTVETTVLSSLKGVALTQALTRYAARAQRGSQDAALLAGTGKDLMEATAAHVMMSTRGAYLVHANFRALLGTAFIELGLAVPEQPPSHGESAAKPLERALFEAACAANRLRNKEGSGHGRPWVPNVRDEEGKAAIEVAGCVSAYLLSKLMARTK